MIRVISDATPEGHTPCTEMFSQPHHACDPNALTMNAIMLIAIDGIRAGDASAEGLMNKSAELSIRGTI